MPAALREYPRVLRAAARVFPAKGEEPPAAPAAEALPRSGFPAPRSCSLDASSWAPERFSGLSTLSSFQERRHLSASARPHWSLVVSAGFQRALQSTSLISCWCCYFWIINLKVIWASLSSCYRYSDRESSCVLGLTGPYKRCGYEPTVFSCCGFRPHPECRADTNPITSAGCCQCLCPLGCLSSECIGRGS